jgi:subtilisin family serine protease
MTPAAVSLDALGLGSDTLSPLATANTDRFEPVEMYDNLAWVIRYNADETTDDGTPLGKQTVLDWADSGDDRRVVSEHDTLDQITVSASRSDIGTRWRDRALGDGGLQAEPNIESIDLVVRMSRPEPVRLEDDSVAGYDLGTWNQFKFNVASVNTPDWSRLAFKEDAPTATLEESRQLCRADASVLDGVDTSGITVAVIDTGVSASSYLQDADGNTRILDASKNIRTGATVADDGLDAVASDDSSDHGPWVARCIAGRDSSGTYRGFADDADVLAAKVLGSDGSGNTDHIIAGVDLAIQEGADVACMSLGSPVWNEALADAIGRAVEEGVFVSIATGNSRYSTTWVASPADVSDGFGVNATNVPESGTRDETKVAYFGNIGPDPGTSDLSEGASNGAKPNLLAPGMAVDVGWTLSGTSMAAPHVAGAAAVLRASEPGLSVQETWNRLVETGHPLQHAGATEGARLLDLQAALNNTDPSDDPSEVRSDAAATRDAFNEWYSSAQGGRFAALFN